MRRLTGKIRAPIRRIKEALPLLKRLEGIRPTSSKDYEQVFKSLGPKWLLSTEQISCITRKSNDYLHFDGLMKKLPVETGKKRKASSVLSGSTFDSTSVEPESSSKRQTLDEDSSNSSKHVYEKNAEPALGHIFEHLLTTSVTAIEKEVDQFRTLLEENGEIDFIESRIRYANKIAPHMAKIAKAVETHIKVNASNLHSKVNYQWDKGLQKLDKFGDFFRQIYLLSPEGPKRRGVASLLDSFAIQHQNILLKLRCLQLHTEIQKNYHDFQTKLSVSAECFKESIQENIGNVQLLRKLETVLELQSTGKTALTQIEQILFHFFISPAASRNTEQLIMNIEKYLQVINHDMDQQIDMDVTIPKYLHGMSPADVKKFDEGMKYATGHIAELLKRRRGGKMYYKAHRYLESARNRYQNLSEKFDDLNKVPERFLQRHQLIPFSQFQQAFSLKETIVSDLQKSGSYFFVNLPTVSDADVSIENHSGFKTSYLCFWQNTFLSTSYDMHSSPVERSYYGSSSTAENAGESSASSLRNVPSSLLPN